MSEKYDIAILGGGPGGYVAAIRAGQLGKKTVVIDKDNLGGICLNWGCIPTKSLLKNAELFDEMKNHAGDFGISFKDLSYDFSKIIKRSRSVSENITKNVEMLVKKNKIDRIRGFGKLVSPNRIEVKTDDGKTQTVDAEHIIIATGARPKEIPPIPVDRKKIITSKEAMVLDKLPKRLIVIGAGAIGIEFAYFYNVLGSEVTVIEMLDRILPVEDKEVSAALTKNFKKRGMKILTDAKVEEAKAGKNDVTVKVTKGGKTEELKADIVLNAIGVQGNIEDIGLEQAGVEVEKNHIKVDKSNYRTTVPNIYAIGDVIGPPWLAHVASAEGVACVEKISGMDVPAVDYGAIPGCTYCQPQVASIGLTEEKAREAGYDVKIGKFPFMGNGKAFAMGDREGFVKLIFDKKYDELIGAHIIGSEATEMIAELGIAITHEGTSESIMRTVHAHPTLSEAVMEAALKANGEAIHI